jgi:rhodanese-related sulfurtransferase
MPTNKSVNRIKKNKNSDKNKPKIVKNSNSKAIKSKHTKTVKGKGRAKVKNSHSIVKSKKTKNRVKSRGKSKNPTIKLCDTCLNVKIVDGNIMSRNKESWKNFPYHLPVLGRTSGPQSVNINLGKKHANCLIYYFGAKTSSNILHGQYPESYKNSSNSGLVKLDKNGKCVIHLDCPMSYKDTDFDKVGKQTYMSHIHLLVSDKSMTKWNDNLYTQNVLCHVNKKQVKSSIKNHNRLIINALSSEYHNKNSIPGSHNLYYKDSKKLSVNQIKANVMMMMKKDTDFAAFVVKHKLNFTEIPIIVYCYSKTCNAGEQLALELFRAGFTNIVDYSGGIMDWMNRGSSC